MNSNSNYKSAFGSTGSSSPSNSSVSGSRDSIASTTTPCNSISISRTSCDSINTINSANKNNNNSYNNNTNYNNNKNNNNNEFADNSSSYTVASNTNSNPFGNNNKSAKSDELNNGSTDDIAVGDGEREFKRGNDGTDIRGELRLPNGTIKKTGILNVNCWSSDRDCLAQEIHDEFLVCKICADIYKTPKTLNCMHTFCERCIEKHLDAEFSYKKYSDYREFSCPLCRRRTHVPYGGVRKLPNNFLVAGLTEAVSRQKPGNYAKKPACDICLMISKTERESCCRCLDCNKLLCVNCSEVHRKTKITNNHVIVDLDNEKEIECKEHREENVRYYCTTCDACVCVICTFNDHRDHDILSLSEASSSFSGHTKTLVAGCKANADLYSEEVVRLRKCEELIKSVEDSIRETAMEFIQEIRNREKCLLEEVRNVFGPACFEMLAKQKDMLLEAENIKNTCTLTEVLLSGRDIEFLLLKKGIEDNLKELSNPKKYFIPPTINKVIEFRKGNVDLGYIHDFERPLLSSRSRSFKANTYDFDENYVHSNQNNNFNPELIKKNTNLADSLLSNLGKKNDKETPLMRNVNSQTRQSLTKLKVKPLQNILLEENNKIEPKNVILKNGLHIKTTIDEQSLNCFINRENNESCKINSYSKTNESFSKNPSANEIKIKNRNGNTKQKIVNSKNNESSSSSDDDDDSSSNSSSSSSSNSSSSSSSSSNLSSDSDDEIIDKTDIGSQTDDLNCFNCKKEMFPIYHFKLDYDLKVEPINNSYDAPPMADLPYNSESPVSSNLIFAKSYPSSSQAWDINSNYSNIDCSKESNFERDDCQINSPSPLQNNTDLNNGLNQKIKGEELFVKNCYNEQQLINDSFDKGGYKSLSTSNEEYSLAIRRRRRRERIQGSFLTEEFLKNQSNSIDCNDKKEAPLCFIATEN